MLYETKCKCGKELKHNPALQEPNGKQKTKGNCLAEVSENEIIFFCHHCGKVIEVPLSNEG